jgi:hypothetical protein
MTEKEAKTLIEAVEKIISRNNDMRAISPAWVATAVMSEIGFLAKMHPVGYVGCHLYVRQIARQSLRKKFDPTDRDDDGDDQHELFNGTLQIKYPRRREQGEEPTYVHIDDLTDDDVEFIVARMRSTARSLLKHADALAAWNAARRHAA